MWSPRLVALALGTLACLLPAANAASSSPVAKVIEMLTNMKVKGNKELATEQAVMDQYNKFVVRRTRELEYEIKTAKASIEELIAVVTKAEAEVASLTRRITDLNGQADQTTAEQKAATELRNTEHAQFLEEQTSYTESLYALDRAIQILSAQNYDREQAMALLQKEAKTTKGMRRVLASLALVQVSASAAQPEGAPAVAAYEFQSGGVVTLLKNLQIKFKDELGELEKAEMNSNSAYDLQMIHSTNMLDGLKAEIASLTEAKASHASKAATGKGQLADTRASLAEAEKLLSDLTSTHRAKTSTYEANQKVRQAELEAIGKAIEILSSPDVAGNYAEHVKVLAQVPNFLQVRSQSRAAIRGKAATYLEARASVLKSKLLATLAASMKDSPFAKVIDMIESLIEKLQEEAASEADHKAFCDEELRKNKMKRKKMESESARLHAEIEEKAMEIEEMGKDLTTLAEEQAELRTAMTEATEQRTKEKAANEEAIKDSQDGQTAVKQAVLVLKEFYSSQGAFLQTKQVPEMEEYKGMQSENGGVVGMLEVIQSDFARVEADTKAAEMQAADEYNKFTEDSEADLKAKHDAEFKLGLKKDQGEFDKGQLEKDLKSTSEQLSMANAYYQELKPQCVTVHVSFEERSKKRAEEVEALKEAYKILDSKATA